jgi:hypothetical protein
MLNYSLVNALPLDRDGLPALFNLANVVEIIELSPIVNLYI